MLLALGPLTNVAELITHPPASAASPTRLVWMGGRAEPGNHSPAAEFNELADPDALARLCLGALSKEPSDG